jgi:hypothetical protein
VEQQRRFPIPWFIHRSSESRFQVLDASGRPLVSVDCGASDHLNESEAWIIAKNIARLPELLKRANSPYLEPMHPIIKRILG